MAALLLLLLLLVLGGAVASKSSRSCARKVCSRSKINDLLLSSIVKFLARIGAPRPGMPLLLLLGAATKLPPLLGPGLPGLLALREGVLGFFLPCLAPPPRPSGFLRMLTVW
jgi:hypothetical protein